MTVEEASKSFQWSEPVFNGTEDLAKPAFSFDGHYLAVQKNWFEGCGTAVIDLSTKAVIAPKYRNGEKLKDVNCGDFNWSPDGNQFFIATWTEVGDVENGLFLSQKNHPEIVDWISPERVRTANFAPDGKEVIFATVNYDTDSYALRLASTDLKFKKTIKEKKPWQALDIENAFFSPSGSHLYTIEKRNDEHYLVQRPLSGNKEVVMVKFPIGFDSFSNASWNKKGFLEVDGYNDFKKSRSLVFDVVHRKIVSSMPFNDLGQ